MALSWGLQRVQFSEMSESKEIDLMHKRLIAIAAAAALALTACGGSGGGETKPSENAKSEQPKQGGSLTIWADETRIGAFKELGAQFKESSGVTLDVVQKPTADIANDFIAQAGSGQGPDLIVTAHDGLGNLVQNGVISPIDFASKADAFNPVAVQAVTQDGKVWGMPYALENIALVRNNKLAKDTPDTLDKLIEQGKSSGSQYPLLVQQGEQGDPYHMYPIQTSFGAPVFQMKDNEYTTDLGMAGPEGEAFAEYIQKLGKEGVLSGDIGGDQAKQLFLDGKSPYMITGPWNTAEFTKAGMDISVLPVPSAGGKPSAPFVGVQVVYVSAKSKNALMANQFIDFLGSKEAQDKLYELGGRVPALTESADSVDDELMSGFNDAAKDGQPMPTIPEMNAVWEFWGNTQIQIIDQKSPDAKAAWQTMIKNIQSKI